MTSAPDADCDNARASIGAHRNMAGPATEKYRTGTPSNVVPSGTLGSEPFPFAFVVSTSTSRPAACCARHNARMLRGGPPNANAGAKYGVT
jgi:hypothetical protein